MMLLRVRMAAVTMQNMQNDGHKVLHCTREPYQMSVNCLQKEEEEKIKMERIVK